MLLGSPARLLSRARTMGRAEAVEEADLRSREAPEPKETESSEKKNPNVVVINTNIEKTKDKIKKIETIKRKKIGKNQKPSELLKYYDYLSYEYPKLVAKNLESEDGDLVSSIKNAFEDKPEDTNKIEVKTSSFVDVGLADKLRRELIDTETKLDVDRRLRDEMARVVKAEEEARKRREEEVRKKRDEVRKVREVKKTETKKAEELSKAREITGKLAPPRTEKVDVPIDEELFSSFSAAETLPAETAYVRKRRTVEELVADAKEEKSKIERAIKSIETQISKDKSAGKSTKKLDKSLEVKQKKLSEIRDKIVKIKSREVRTLTI